MDDDADSDKSNCARRRLPKRQKVAVEKEKENWNGASMICKIHLSLSLSDWLEEEDISRTQLVGDKKRSKSR